MIRLCLTDLLSQGTSSDDSSAWLKFKAGDGSVVAFWGSLELGFVNINMLRYQILPIVVDLEDSDLCEPKQNEKSRFGCDYSVPEECYITIHPVLENI